MGMIDKVQKGSRGEIPPADVKYQGGTNASVPCIVLTTYLNGTNVVPSLALSSVQQRSRQRISRCEPITGSASGKSTVIGG